MEQPHTLTITEEIYNNAPRVSKWCPACGEITEHLKIWIPFREQFAEVCNQIKHTIKMGG